ncbi:MAG: bifunctional 5,10-methylenetetrahydrofolate dehydrogenase/5,10-methenyltetrahydrofolate cyclohydrolase [Candidatus Omnitrophica bacterium]|nr:bifunctional 5,10-methylenetetrahydrofolate dehydrogenase/5,10-methenyltetrahydrofolate cyclohydrolase [Candidatus Omnitrophota bacterium]MDD4012981.1 bifunctional 5,10-methylenetetrahydrofolate dehydrogenase/5,10-methenyltetrahydrofolate cyclohydrolase [Candidatus Omnitrophota bacterium]
MSVHVDGKEIARHLNDSIREKVSALSVSAGRPPRLVSLCVGHNEEAQIYVKMQEKAAEKVGIAFERRVLDAGLCEKELLGEIDSLNADTSVTAVIVQKPLPFGIEHDRVVEALHPEKDAEGLHPYNLGRIFRREADIVPCTPGAVMRILREHHVELYGKEVVLVGHSAIVGKPLSMMMLNESATTTVCHIGTAEKGDIISHSRKADILVVAVGRPWMVTGDWVKRGAVVIDVGINKQDGAIVGDVLFPEVEKKASLITPVPGGVGPITVSILMRNVLRAYRSQNVGA